MRFKIKKRPKQTNIIHLSWRNQLVRFFAWLPVRVKETDEVRWLETVVVHQQINKVAGVWKITNLRFEEKMPY